MLVLHARARCYGHPVRVELSLLNPTSGQAFLIQLYRQVILHHGLPFAVQNFNEETRTVLKKSELGVEVTRFDSAEALFEDLGI